MFPSNRENTSFHFIFVTEFKSLSLTQRLGFPFASAPSIKAVSSDHFPCSLLSRLGKANQLLPRTLQPITTGIQTTG